MMCGQFAVPVVASLEAFASRLPEAIRLLRTKLLMSPTRVLLASWVLFFGKLATPLWYLLLMKLPRGFATTSTGDRTYAYACVGIRASFLPLENTSKLVGLIPMRMDVHPTEQALVYRDSASGPRHGIACLSSPVTGFQASLATAA